MSSNRQTCCCPTVSCFDLAKMARGGTNSYNGIVPNYDGQNVGDTYPKIVCKVSSLCNDCPEWTTSLLDLRNTFGGGWSSISYGGLGGHLPTARRVLGYQPSSSVPSSEWAALQSIAVSCFAGDARKIGLVCDMRLFQAIGSYSFLWDTVFGGGWNYGGDGQVYQTAWPSGLAVGTATVESYGTGDFHWHVDETITYYSGMSTLSATMVQVNNGTMPFENYWDYSNWQACVNRSVATPRLWFREVNTNATPVAVGRHIPAFSCRSAQGGTFGGGYSQTAVDINGTNPTLSSCPNPPAPGYLLCGQGYTPANESQFNTTIRVQMCLAGGPTATGAAAAWRVPTGFDYFGFANFA